MPAPLDLLLDYDSLPPAQRGATDRHLAAHPKDLGVVELGRRLRELQRAAAHGEPLDDALLAHVLVTTRADPRPELHALVEQRLAALPDVPDLSDRLARLTERLGLLEDALPSPEAHFEQLTGLSLTPKATDSNGHPAPRPARPRHTDGLADRSADRPAARRPASRTGSHLRFAATFLILLVAGYGALALVSATSIPPHERLAALSEVDAPAPPIRMRGAPSSLTERSEALAEAVSEVRAARSATLGLFPRYDEARLARAEALLNQVIAPAPDDTLSMEAELLLGRIALHRSEVERARDHLQRVVAQGGPGATEAAELLRALDREAT